MKEITFTAETNKGTATLTFKVSNETLEAIKKDLIQQEKESLYSVYKAKHDGQNIILGVTIGENFGCMSM